MTPDYKQIQSSACYIQDFDLQICFGWFRTDLDLDCDNSSKSDYGQFVGCLFMFITHLISTLPGKIPAVLLDKLPYNCGFIHLTWSEHEAGG